MILSKSLHIFLFWSSLRISRPCFRFRIQIFLLNKFWLFLSCSRINIFSRFQWFCVDVWKPHFIILANIVTLQYLFILLHRRTWHLSFLRNLKFPMSLVRRDFEPCFTCWRHICSLPINLFLYLLKVICGGFSKERLPSIQLCCELYLLSLYTSIRGFRVKCL